MNLWYVEWCLKHQSGHTWVVTHVLTRLLDLAFLGWLRTKALCRRTNSRSLDASGTSPPPFLASARRANLKSSYGNLLTPAKPIKAKAVLLMWDWRKTHISGRPFVKARNKTHHLYAISSKRFSHVENRNTPGNPKEQVLNWRYRYIWHIFGHGFEHV